MEDVSNNLRQILGTLVVLQAQTQIAHWNVIGPNFSSLHDLFQGQYEDIFGAIDETAEHIRQLGPEHFAPQNVETLISESVIRPFASVHETVGVSSDMMTSQMLNTLILGHENVLDLLKRGVRMAEEQSLFGLEDFLSGRVAAHAKHLWMLKATAG